jgi:hypothetical protein
MCPKCRKKAKEAFSNYYEEEYEKRDKPSQI